MVSKPCEYFPYLILIYINNYRKEEEKLALEEEKKKKIAENVRKQQVRIFNNKHKLCCLINATAKKT